MNIKEIGKFAKEHPVKTALASAGIVLAGFTTHHLLTSAKAGDPCGNPPEGCGCEYRQTLTGLKCKITDPCSGYNVGQKCPA